MNQQAANQLQQNIFDIYQALDQIQKIMPMLMAGWKVNIPSVGTSALPSDKVIQLLQQYEGFRDQIVKSASQMPTSDAIGQ